MIFRFPQPGFPNKLIRLCFTTPWHLHGR